MDIKTRRFIKGDEKEISKIIIKDIYHENIKDYPKKIIDILAKRMTPEFVLKRAEVFHGYVATDNDKIVGIGMIGPYWDSPIESSLFTIFIDPEYLNKGIGKTIIKALEEDEYYKRADRVEVPASITGLGFYRHMGYGFKRTDKVLGNIVDDEGEYRLEKYPKESYYNETDIYNIRPYIDNEYHDFNSLIKKFKKFNNESELKEYTSNHNLCIIEYNGKEIGFYSNQIQNEDYIINDLYLLQKYEEKFKEQIIKDITQKYNDKNIIIL